MISSDRSCRATPTASGRAASAGAAPRRGVAQPAAGVALCPAGTVRSAISRYSGSRARGEREQAFAPIRRGQQRTLAIARQACQLLVDRRFQIHDEAAFAQQLPVFRRKHGAAAGGEHDAGTRANSAEQRAIRAGGIRPRLRDRRSAESRAAVCLRSHDPDRRTAGRAARRRGVRWSSCRRPSGRRRTGLARDSWRRC